MQSKNVLKKPIVTESDLLNTIDFFTLFSIQILSPAENDICRRYLKLVEQKHFRTSFVWKSSNIHQLRLMAFQSHNRISSLCAANKSSSGRSESHRFGRYISKMGDLFKGLASLQNKCASPVSLPFSGKTGRSLSKGISHVRS
jgi:hypothetical protein